MEVSVYDLLTDGKTLHGWETDIENAESDPVLRDEEWVSDRGRKRRGKERGRTMTLCKSEKPISEDSNKKEEEEQEREGSERRRT